METRTLWNERLGVLIAGAGPGSALAYALGKTVFEPMMLQRATVSEEMGSAAVKPVFGGAPKRGEPARSGDRDRSRSWLIRLFDRLETWSWERQVREREAYLAQSRDLADLEYRMRQLDRTTLLRGRSLS